MYREPWGRSVALPAPAPRGGAAYLQGRGDRGPSSRGRSPAIIPGLAFEAQGSKVLRTSLRRAIALTVLSQTRTMFKCSTRAVSSSLRSPVTSSLEDPSILAFFAVAACVALAALCSLRFSCEGWIGPYPEFLELDPKSKTPTHSSAWCIKWRSSPAV